MNRSFIALLVALLSPTAFAQITIKDAWVRATVAQQKATGAFMQLQAAQDSKLVAAQSPVAGVVEVHEMAMDNGVMKMRAVPSLALPAGKAIELKPGGYHVMLMDLKGRLKEGETVPVTLVVEGKDGKREKIEVKALVRGMAPHAMQHGQGHSHGKGEHKH